MSSEGQSFRLQFRLSRDDYQRFFSVAAKRQSNWRDTTIYIGAFALALPVAFAARAFAANETTNPLDVELAGLVGLLAYFAGLLAFLAAYGLQRRLSIAASFTHTPGVFDDISVVLDDQGVVTDSRLSRVHRNWPAFTGVTAASGLVLLWIGPQFAILIPDRAFTDAEARDSAIAFARARVTAAQ